MPSAKAGVADLAWNPTPFGLLPRQCVYGVPSGSDITENGTIIEPGGLIVHVPPCPYQTPPSTSDWIVYAQTSTSTTSYGEFDAVWTVPSGPASYDGQILNLWNGLQPYNEQSTPLLQPVLQWGNGVTSWQISSWVYISGNSYFSSPQTVSVGDQIEGMLSGSSCNSSGSCNWLVDTIDLTAYHSTSIYCGSGISQLCGVKTTFATTTLEAWNVVKCTDYPGSSPTTFSQILLKNTGGTQMYPGWLPHVRVHDCGEQVTSPNYATTNLFY